LPDVEEKQNTVSDFILQQQPVMPNSKSKGSVDQEKEKEKLAAKEFRMKRKNL
jgi:hypothetical protein